MKKRMLLFIAACLLAMSACVAQPPQPTTAPTTQPATVYDFTFNMAEFDHFGHIFEEKTPEQWENLGCYTILLEGLDTPVTVQMEGMTVLSVSAYGQTAQTNISAYQEETPANIQSARGVIVVNEALDSQGRSWLLTADWVTAFCPQGDISTQVFVTAEGALRYRTYWSEYVTTFEQWDYAPLELCTSRKQFLYSTGAVTVTDGLANLRAEETVTVSDLYDLDALFAAAQAEGYFPEFDSVDALFASNAQK